ncbi:MAG: hypothetical protein SVX43_17195 [Cyanobacteriota bacterium]|nr:hypothetical protein [Cyanobacteriota bacterium]
MTKISRFETQIEHPRSHFHEGTRSRSIEGFSRRKMQRTGESFYSKSSSTESMNGKFSHQEKL